MAIMYASLETGNLNRNDVVISSSAPGTSTDTVVIQFDDSDSSQTVLNTLYKIERVFWETWVDISGGTTPQIISYILAADDESPSDDTQVVPGTTPSGANTVRLQVDALNMVEPLVGTIQKILVAMYPTLGGGLPDGAIWLNDPANLTVSRTGGRASFFPGQDDVAANTVDQCGYFSAVFQGETNITSTQFDSDWIPANASISSGVLTEAPTSAAHRATAVLSGSPQHYISLRARSPSADRSILLFRNAQRNVEKLEVDLQTGAVTDSTGLGVDDYAVSLAGDGWVDILVYLSSGSPTDGIIIGLSIGTGTDDYLGNGTSNIEIDRCMVSDTTYPTVATPAGSASGANYGSDNISYASPPWGDGKGTVLTCVIPGWAPAAEGPTATPRFFAANGSNEYVFYNNGSSALVAFTNNSFTTSKGAGWDEVSPYVSSMHLDGNNCTLTIDDSTTSAAASTGTFTNSIFFGSNSANYLNGAVAAFYWNRELTTEEFDQARTFLINAANECMGNTNPPDDFQNILGLSFNGSDQYAITENTTSIFADNEAITISFWMQGYQAKDGYISYTTSQGSPISSAFFQMISRDSGAGLIFQLRDRSGNQFRMSNVGNPTTNANQFTHYVFVYDGGDKASVYRDGILDSTQTVAAFTGEIDPAGDDVLSIGRSLIKGYGDTVLDEVAIWQNVEFDQDDVTEVFNSGLARDLNNLPTIVPPTDWYRMGDLIDFPQRRMPDQGTDFNDFETFNLGIQDLRPGVDT